MSMSLYIVYVSRLALILYLLFSLIAIFWYKNASLFFISHINKILRVLL